ncbi:hypothetical protein DJ010_09495 [Nocardioides silvaticus]|uniref:DoxX family protein n=1 Tax=Nocardioides silvaticus TaxID=2201891 RepID=A0A316TFN3_9ACTN|nr:hypothetical protein [Nocardioides silvaticus]PWN03333.1 hypothetical protein DJ010_09495 [Nocardioides silvaticus]
MNIDWFLPVTWLSLGVVVVGSGLRAHHSLTGYRTGVYATSALWVLGGAAGNLWLLARGGDYSGFADGASSDFVRETWETLVVPHHTFFIGLLIVGETLAGLLVLVPGRVRQAALLSLIGFNVLLLSFGWAYLVWTVPLVLALALLWHAGRPAGAARVVGPGHSGRATVGGSELCDEA